MAITVGDGAMTVDFTGSDPQVEGPFNCGDAITISACRLLIKCLTTPHDLVDEGGFRPLRVVIPKRSVLAAEEPAPTARYYVPINLLIELGLRALAPAIPDRVPAGAYGDQMPTIAFGTHPETGRLFIQGDLNAGGTGRAPHLRWRVRDDHLRGLDRAQQSRRGRGVALAVAAHPALRPAAGLRRRRHGSAAASASSASTSS